MYNLGRTKEIPSSTFIFAEWYNQETGIQPSYFTVSLWAALDVLEKVYIFIYICVCICV
jgi:hypothetical protein